MKYLSELSDTLEELSEIEGSIFDDVRYSDGVLTITMHDKRCYVINKQTPNKQIWLSSPVSGPQRFAEDAGEWHQIRSGQDLINLLETEFN